MNITIETLVQAPVAQVWAAWNDPRAIERWNTASPDWHTPRATVDLRVGGGFSSRMEARDGSMGFDLTGTYTKIVPHELIEFSLEDGRVVLVEFVAGEEGVKVRETFDAESTHPPEMQRAGWQAILDRFVRHAEAER